MIIIKSSLSKHDSSELRNNTHIKSKKEKKARNKVEEEDADRKTASVEQTKDGLSALQRNCTACQSLFESN